MYIWTAKALLHQQSKRFFIGRSLAWSNSQNIGWLSKNRKLCSSSSSTVVVVVEVVVVVVVVVSLLMLSVQFVNVRRRSRAHAARTEAVTITINHGFVSCKSRRRFICCCSCSVVQYSIIHSFTRCVFSYRATPCVSAVLAALLSITFVYCIHSNG